MKIHRRIDKYGPFDRLLTVETISGKEYDLTWWFYGVIGLIILFLIF